MAMDLSIQQWGQIMTLSMIAIALGMDAFSLGLGIGIKQISYRKMACISMLIGVLHVVLPLFGMYVGQYLSIHMKEIAAHIGGAMLCVLGLNMLIGVLRNNSDHRVFCVESTIAILLLSISVSLDSLSAGLSLGLFNADRFLAVSLFGSIGAVMTGSGLLLGRSVGHWLGGYGEVMGGIILCILGSKLLW